MDNLTFTPPFKVTMFHKNILGYDIEILAKDCLFLNFLIQTSRIHWRKELEQELPKLSPEDQRAYLEKNKFNIAGPLLNPLERYQQKLHLLNKIYAIGYLLSGEKDRSKPWAVTASDYVRTPTGKGIGSTGKSLLFAYGIGKAKAITFTINGRDQNRIEDPFLFSGLTKDYDLILIDHVPKFFRISQFFEAITGDILVNTRFKEPFVIPFEESPKLAFICNFDIAEAGPSMERRLLNTVFSDYYHSNRKGDYNESRNPQDDFGKLLFVDFDERDWSQFDKTIAACIEIFKTAPEKINPPLVFEGRITT